jgi:DNA-binding CsgD family transcriptional regulator
MLVVFTVPLDPQRAVEHADAALRVLSEEREPGLLAHVLINLFYAEAVLGRGSRRELLERGLELEARAGPAAAKSTIPLIWFHCTDDFDAARARHASEDQWYRERGEEGWRAERLAHLGLAELRAGQWELAEQYVEQSCAELDQFSGSGPWAMPFYMRSLVDAHRGRTERARTTLLPLIEKAAQGYQPFWTALLLSTLGFVEWAAGQHEAADRALTQMRERLDTIGVVDFPGDRSEPFHIETLLALGERDRARDLLRDLEERGRTLPRIWISATLPRARALVLAADGDVAGALESIEELDAAASQLPFELGRTLLVQGQLHRRTKQKRAAADTLRKALDIFERLGAPKWAELARDELARVGLRRSSDQLTATELRVAELAALGLTNREVANAAFMSPKTVEANLTRVYHKLDIHSRAELGAQMADRRRTFETQT